MTLAAADNRLRLVHGTDHASPDQYQRQEAVCRVVAAAVCCALDPMGVPRQQVDVLRAAAGGDEDLVRQACRQLARTDRQTRSRAHDGARLLLCLALLTEVVEHPASVDLSGQAAATARPCSAPSSSAGAVRRRWR